jgi:hypothetical protein
VATQADVWGFFNWPDAKSPKKPKESYLVVCSGCEEPFFVEYYQDRSKLLRNLTVEAAVKGEIGEGWEWHKLYPIEVIPDAPKHLPIDVELNYAEACGCLAHGFPNAAGAMFRKTLEATTKSKPVVEKIGDAELEKYNSSQLSARLKVLKDLSIIPLPLFELVNTIKLEGNEAVHGMTSYTMEEASILKEFVDALLNFVFSLPAKMQAVRTARDKK